MTVLATGEETGGRFAILHVIKPDGSSTPPHSHDAESELVYPLVGSVGVETEGRIWRFGPGETVMLPPGRPHRLFNDSGKMAREFLLCAPAIFDRFVAAAGTEVVPRSVPAAMTDEARRRLIAAAPAFGIRFRRSATPKGDALEVPARPRISIDVLGLRLDVLAQLGTGDEALLLLRCTVHPGRSIPLQSAGGPQCLFVINGVLDLYRAESGWTRMRAEQAIIVGANARHAAKNAGPLPSYVLLVTTTRLVQFLAAIGTPATGPEPPPRSAEQVAAFSARGGEFGLWTGSRDENIAIGIRG